MKVIQTALPCVLIIEPKVLGDACGFFLETFQVERYRNAGIALPFVQDNHSRSQRGVLGRLHLQKTKPQGKLVRISRGAVYDVAVDTDQKSPTFGQYTSASNSATTTSARCGFRPATRMVSACSARSQISSTNASRSTTLTMKGVLSGMTRMSLSRGPRIRLSSHPKIRPCRACGI